MRKSIIIVWGILLLIKQGDIIGSDECTYVSIPGSQIRHQICISQSLDNSKLPNLLEVYEDDSSDESRSRIPMLYGFYRYSIYYDTYQEIFDINFPRGIDSKLKTRIEKTYRDLLDKAKGYGIQNISFTSIFNESNSLNLEGKVVITPTEEANIAISTIHKFFKENPKLPKYNIYFLLKKKNDQLHYLVYKRSVGLQMTDEEKLEAKNLEDKFIKNLEDSSGYTEAQQQQEQAQRQQEQAGGGTDFIKKIKSWKGVVVIGTFSALLIYLITKYYSSR